MNVREIRNLVIKADINAQHYWSSQTSKGFTVWREYEMLPITADDQHEEKWRFQIDRFAETEFDEIAEAIRSVLDDTTGVTYSYQVDFEGKPDERGLIHHIFDCQG